ncbi:MAG: ATP-binding protein [Spirulina sp.]
MTFPADSHPLSATITLEDSSTNDQALQAEVAALHQRLQALAPADTPISTPDTPLPTPHSPTLDHLCRHLGLSAFERQVVLLCLGLELDPQWPALCAAVPPHRPYPTWSLALALSPDAHWTALPPNAPLRRWQVVEIGPGNALVDSPLRLDEQILHDLMGHHSLHERLLGLGAKRIFPEPIIEAHHRLATSLAQTWVSASQAQRPLPLIHLWGRDRSSLVATAAALGDLLGLELWTLAATALPTDPAQVQSLGKLWEREWQLHRRVLLLSGDTEHPSPERDGAMVYLVDALGAPLMLTAPERRAPSQRPQVAQEVPLPSPQEQRQIWSEQLGDQVAALNGHLNRLVSHFNLSRDAIETACYTVQGHADTDLANALWQACRTQARPQLDALAERIQPAATWDDLVLPDREMAILKEVAAHVRQRAKVYEQWGFADKGQRGLGISALFAGASGTGKTLSAEILGHALDLDVYRIDLSAVVSKYIGETEKNLRRVFDAAEGSGVVLLFDEADALFGKRTEVKDSHDRHANLEVSYLLQRMEAYRGLAILTTNLKASLDQAFLRRIRFVVQFPFPDVAQRTEIWRRSFPPQAPQADLDFAKLARLNVPGGNIRNIALNAAFLAADADQPIAMAHLLQAARSEYLKLERPLTDTEVKGWV